MTPDELVLYSLDLAKERDGWVLRVVIDKDGVSLDECEQVSRALSAWLDENDIIPASSYQLEVSTPGFDRPLVTEQDFIRFTGKLIRLDTKTKDESGRKRYAGRISQVENGRLSLYVEKESQTFTLDIENIAKARLEAEF